MYDLLNRMWSDYTYAFFMYRTCEGYSRVDNLFIQCFHMQEVEGAKKSRAILALFKANSFLGICSNELLWVLGCF